MTPSSTRSWASCCTKSGGRRIGGIASRNRRRVSRARTGRGDSEIQIAGRVAKRDRAAPGSSREDAGSAAPPCASLSLARLRRAEMPSKCRRVNVSGTMACMAGALSKAQVERRVFERLAPLAGYQVAPDSIRQDPPPAPDIECEVVGEGVLAVELVALDHESTRTRLSNMFSTREAWDRALGTRPSWEKIRLSAECENVFLSLLFDESAGSRSRRDAICRFRIACWPWAPPLTAAYLLTQSCPLDFTMRSFMLGTLPRARKSARHLRVTGCRHRLIKSGRSSPPSGTRRPDLWIYSLTPRTTSLLALSVCGNKLICAFAHICQAQDFAACMSFMPASDSSFTVTRPERCRVGQRPRRDEAVTAHHRTVSARCLDHFNIALQ